MKIHEFLATVPFDLYDLGLFSLVCSQGSFTKAGTAAGLTQSAMTRRISLMEEKLGLRLFERTTRQLKLTSAGRDFRSRIEPLLAQTLDISEAFRSKLGLRPVELSIGLARSIGLAYLPGFFFAFQRKCPDIQLNVIQDDSQEILRALDAGELDAGLICPPKALPRTLIATHRFRDDFVLITPPRLASAKMSLASARKLLTDERWLLLKAHGNTGRAQREWLEKQSWPVVPTMELDSFDMIANLVSLDLGVSMVPHRVLPLYGKRRLVNRIVLPQRFSRQLAVVVRRSQAQSSPLKEFIEQILF